MVVDYLVPIELFALQGEVIRVEEQIAGLNAHVKSLNDIIETGKAKDEELQRRISNLEEAILTARDTQQALQADYEVQPPILAHL